MIVCRELLTVTAHQIVSMSRHHAARKAVGMAPGAVRVTNDRIAFPNPPGPDHVWTRVPAH